jgi:hypothetical protein
VSFNGILPSLVASLPVSSENKKRVRGKVLCSEERPRQQLGAANLVIKLNSSVLFDSLSRNRQVLNGSVFKRLLHAAGIFPQNPAHWY